MRIIVVIITIPFLIIGCESSNKAEADPTTDTILSGNGSDAESPITEDTEAIGGSQPLDENGSNAIDSPPGEGRSVATGGVGEVFTAPSRDSGVDAHIAPDDAINESDVSDAGDPSPSAGTELTGEIDSTDASIPAQGGAGGEDNETGIVEDDESEPPYAVGTVRIEISAGENRVLPVQLWYPAVESARTEAEQGHPTEEFEPPGERRDQLAAMLANSPDGCTSKVMHAAQAPEVLSQSAPFPGVVFSHCMACVRFSTFTVAEHLASLGFVVAAPDHVNGTIYDASPSFDEAFLQVRVNDVKSLVDTLLDAQNALLPGGLRGKVDNERIGMYGHSYGSITTGRMLHDDSRVKAGVMIAAPIDVGSDVLSLFLERTDIESIKQPALFLEALEDFFFINPQMEKNYEAIQNPAWLVQLRDAGHFSFTDIAGFRMDEPNVSYSPGCGTGPRADNLFENFTYVDNDVARGITKAYIAAFFQSQLNGDTSAGAYLETSTPAEIVVVKSHP